MKKYLLVWLSVALFAAACGSSDDASETTVTTIVTTSSSTPTTIVATTTTTTAATTTTTTAATTTTTEAATTTTTTEPPPAEPATIRLTRVGVQAGEVWVPFSEDDDVAVAAIEAVLGAPTKDTGWIPSWGDYGACPEPMMRAVEWGSLITLYTTAENDFWSPEGVQHFYAYNYFDNAPPLGLLTPEGIGVGSTLADLEAAYPGEIEVDEAFFDSSLGFWSYRLATWTGMWGYATGQAADSTITSINGGQGCGE